MRPVLRTLPAAIFLASCAPAPEMPSRLSDDLQPGDSATSGGGDTLGASTGDQPTASGDTGPGDANPGSGDAAASSVLTQARCGLGFSWLPAQEMGQLLTQEQPYDTLTVPETVLLDLALANEGVDLERVPAYGTLAHRIRYTSQDRGQAQEATGFVIVPDVSEATTFPVLVFLHGTVGLNDQCAPSRYIDDDESEQFIVGLILSMVSSYGYIVVAPDYHGLKGSGDPSTSLHPYLVGEPTAIAVWDSVRAAQRLLQSDDSRAEAGRVALWGASQGGHAAMFTALYASHYAPEIDLGAAVYAIGPSDLATHFSQAATTLKSATGNLVLFLAGASAWWDLPTNGLLAPWDTTVPPALAAECSPTTLDGLEDVTATSEVFTEEFIEDATNGFDGQSTWDCIARESSATRSSLTPPTVPGLFVVAEDDPLVEPAIERDAFDTLCAQGHSLEYLECAGANHSEGFLFSIDNALDFIDEQLGGTAAAPSCSRGGARVCRNTP